MSLQLSEQILVNHIVEQLKNAKTIDNAFESVKALKEKQHVDNQHVLSLMLEFFGPFKKNKPVADDETGDIDAKLMSRHPEVKQAQKKLKTAVAVANKAAGTMKAVDLTKPSDLSDKLGSVVQALSALSDAENEVSNMEDFERSDIVSPEIMDAIQSVYAMAAYSLNSAKAMIDRHLKELQTHVSPQALKVAMSRLSGKMDKADLAGQQGKFMQSPLKTAGKMLAAPLTAPGGGEMGMPGAPRMREEKESK